MKSKNIYVFFIAIALLTGAISAILTSNNMNLYSTIIQPPFTPPSIVFPVVWTILFTLMGISAARIFIAEKRKLDTSLILWFSQLLVNFLWSIIFFNFKAYLFAFLWLLLLWAIILAMILKFYRKDKIAAYLQIPYLIWVTFAGYITLAINMLNN